MIGENTGRRLIRRLSAPLVAATAVVNMPVAALRTLLPRARPAPAGETTAPEQVSPPYPAEAESPPAARPRRRLRTLLELCVYVAAILLTVALTPTLLSSVLNTQYPLAGVTSSSMWPTLHKGDMVVLQGVEASGDLAVGDIIGFKQEDGGFAIHRVVKIDGDKITTKGDANRDADPVIDFNTVVGKVPTVAGKLVKVRYLGYIGILLGPILGHTAEDSSVPGPPTFEGVDDGRDAATPAAPLP